MYLPIKNSATRLDSEFSPYTLFVYILALSTMASAFEEWPIHNIMGLATFFFQFLWDKLGI